MKTSLTSNAIGNDPPPMKKGSYSNPAFVAGAMGEGKEGKKKEVKKFC